MLSQHLSPVENATSILQKLHKQTLEVRKISTFVIGLLMFPHVNVNASMCRILTDSEVKNTKMWRKFRQKSAGSCSHICGAVVYCLAKSLIRTKCSSWINKGALIVNCRQCPLLTIKVFNVLPGDLMCKYYLLGSSERFCPFFFFFKKKLNIFSMEHQ